MLVKKAAADVLKLSQLKSFDLLNPSSYIAYREIADFCLLDLSRPAFLETSARFISNYFIFGRIC
jgi:hypothetical protein